MSKEISSRISNIKKKYSIVIKTITDINPLIGEGLNTNVQEISVEEYKAGKACIFNDAIDRIGE